MTMTSIKTDTYFIKDNYFVDIVQDLDMLYAYLYNENYGVKDFLSGMNIEDISYEEFCELIENGIDDDIQFYHENYEDEEE